MEKMYFNPGCALSIYKPHLEEDLFRLLKKEFSEIEMHKVCCRHQPGLQAGSVIVNVCAGCDRRFGSLYEGVSTVSLWELLDRSESFVFPDYSGKEISVHDPCPVRGNPKVHQAVRNLLEKMNIKVKETEHIREKSVCCGDDFYGKIPLEQVHDRMKKRADSMPAGDVCVYCVSCIKSMYIGGKNPLYLPDLLMGETTHPGIYETVEWHDRLNEYIETH